MRRAKIENDLPLGRGQASQNPLMAALIVSALVISGAAVSVLSGHCEDKQTQQQTTKLILCNPEQKRRVEELLQKSRNATREQAKGVLGDLDKILDQKLDCGWENVKDAHANLSSRHQL